jgi:hypothetical protein
LKGKAHETASSPKGEYQSAKQERTPVSKSPREDDPFFIGWSDTPAVDRRFFLRTGIGLSTAAAGLGLGLAALQPSPGPGTWNPDAVREWRGIVRAQPYAMLRTHDLGGGPRTALLSCLGKCGVAARIDALAGLPVVVTGSLIQRGQHAMIAVDEVGDWIRRDTAAATDAALNFPTLQALGDVNLVGEILDSKCWFGAMRPSTGKVHKACASLCIRGGIPPAFFARGPGQQEALMIMTSGARAYGPDLLPLVGEPVRLSGRVFRQGDLLVLDAPVGAMHRV